jgi:putative hydrolase of the HAD superfamily
MTPTGYRAVIFDFFGTLTTAMTRGPAHDLAAVALGCEPGAFAAQLDRTYPVRASGQFGDAGTAMWRIARRLGSSPGPAQVTEAVRLKTAAIRAGIRIRPDAVGTLTRLRDAGLRTGLISDCTEELPELMAELPVASLLDAMVFSVEQGVTKPHPRLFLTACRLLGVSPHQCFYVGDGGGRELSGARATGMTAIRLAAPDLAGHLVFDREAEWTGASVESLTDLLDVALPSPVHTGRP